GRRLRGRGQARQRPVGGPAARPRRAAGDDRQSGRPPADGRGPPRVTRSANQSEARRQRSQRMWTARSEELADARGLRFAVDRDSRPATFADVLRGWQGDAGFRTLSNALLADAPFTAFRWETPAVTAATEVRPFEFVLLDSPDLARHPDPGAFAKHFRVAQEGVAVFPNLGGDAVMVVPCPAAEPSAYGHLAAFVRLAPRAAATRPLASGRRGDAAACRDQAGLAQHRRGRGVMAARAARR